MYLCQINHQWPTQLRIHPFVAGPPHRAFYMSSLHLRTPTHSRSQAWSSLPQLSQASLCCFDAHLFVVFLQGRQVLAPRPWTSKQMTIAVNSHVTRILITGNCETIYLETMFFGVNINEDQEIEKRKPLYECIGKLSNCVLRSSRTLEVSL